MPPRCRNLKTDILWGGTHDHRREALAERVATDLGTCQYAGGICRALETCNRNTNTANNNNQWGSPVGKTFGAMVVLVMQRGKIVGAAACDATPQKIEVDFLCSSRTCTGAGAATMAEVQRQAKILRIPMVTLISTDAAQGFYRKIGFNTIPNRTSMFMKRTPGVADPASIEDLFGRMYLAPLLKHARPRGRQNRETYKYATNGSKSRTAFGPYEMHVDHARGTARIHGTWPARNFSFENAGSMKAEGTFPGSFGVSNVRWHDVRGGGLQSAYAHMKQ